MTHVVPFALVLVPAGEWQIACAQIGSDFNAPTLHDHSVNPTLIEMFTANRMVEVIWNLSDDLSVIHGRTQMRLHCFSESHLVDSGILIKDLVEGDLLAVLSTVRDKVI